MPPTADAPAPADVPATAAPPTSMRALLQPTYGGVEVLSVGERPVPVPGPDEVLVRVAAAALGRGDLHCLSGRPYLMRLFGFGLRRLREPVPGFALAGTVVTTGAAVTTLAPGERVVGERVRGACAEYAVVPAQDLAVVPDGVPLRDAATLPVGATTAWQALGEAGGLTAGQRLLVHGGSGAVGGFAVPLGKVLGAHVTAAVRPAHVEGARAGGADVVLDVSRDDPTAPTGAPVDLVLDLVGDHPPEAWRPVLAADGTYLAVGERASGDWLGPLAWMARVARANRRGSQRMATFLVKSRAADLEALLPLLADGRVRPRLDRVLPLDQGVEAFRQLLAGPNGGRTLVVMEPAGEDGPG